MVAGASCRREGRLLPWRQEVFFISDIAVLRRGEAVEQAALAAVRPVALRGFKKSGAFQIADCAAA